MITIDETATRDCLPFNVLIPTLRTQFIRGCQVPLRHAHSIDVQGGSAATMLMMPAWVQGGRLGVKVVNIFPDNGTRSLPGLHSIYMLFDASTGVPLALIDGNEITSRRTAAASALAASMLAHPGATNLLVVGAGRVGRLMPDAYRTVLPITSVTVWDVNEALASALVDDLNRRGIRAKFATDLQSAVERSHVVTCATLATSPLIRGRWLSPGTHVDLIGSFTPAMREADDDCFANNSIFMDTDEAWIKSGDLLGPNQSGVLKREDVLATLADLCQGTHRGRRSEQEITVYKAVGTALEDLAAASLVFDAQFSQQV